MLSLSVVFWVSSEVQHLPRLQSLPRPQSLLPCQSSFRSLFKLRPLLRPLLQPRSRLSSTTPTLSL